MSDNFLQVVGFDPLLISGTNGDPVGAAAAAQAAAQAFTNTQLTSYLPVVTTALPRAKVTAGRGNIGVGNFPARFLAKVLQGTAVKVTFLGDSVYQGSTASNPGVNDAASIFCSTVQTRFGVTVTKSNRCQGGRTAWWEFLEQWANALSDNADLYVLALTGKNDGAWETGITKRTGYMQAASLAQIEAKIRELMSARPNADILIASGNPYGTASTSSNVAQKGYSAGLAALAAAYGLGYADGWNLTPRDPLDSNAADPSYLFDGVHPNDAGHAVLGAALTAFCPANFDISMMPTNAVLSSLPAPAGSVYPLRQSRKGVSQIITASTTPGTDRLINPSFTGAHWNAGSTGPWTNSTAGEAVWFMAKATDIFAQFTYGVGQGKIDIHVDGQVVDTAVDLSTFTAGKWLQLAAGLTPGVHNVRIVVNTGTVTVIGFGISSAPCEFIPINSSRVTIGGTGLGAADNTNEWFSQLSNNSTNGETITFDFVGTGFLLQGRSATGGSGGFYFSSITVDGVAVSAPIWPANMVNEVANVALSGCTGLTYGRHTVVMTLQATGLYHGGFSIIDEHPEHRASVSEGIAKVGETVTFPYPWTDSPTVTVTSTTANAAGAASVTASSFVVTGTAGDLVRWRATASQRGVY